MNKTLVLYLLVFIIISCKPSFNLSKEANTIQDLVHGRLDFDSQLELLPDTYWDSISKKDVIKLSDSIKKVFDSTFFKESDVIKNSFEISKISSTKKISNAFFKIIRLNNNLVLKKNRENIYLYDFKSFLDWNLIKYFEYKDKLKSSISIHDENYLLAFRKSNSKKWNYINYSDSANHYLFGLNTAKEIIQLYFDEIFISAKQPWSKEDSDLFYEVYNEGRYNDTYNGLNFDKFCKCKIKFEEKIEEQFDEIPDEYYESLTYIDIIKKCKIYSKK